MVVDSSSIAALWFVLFFIACTTCCGEETLNDPLRPGFHFLPESNWMNDPNGPFYDQSTGIFHLFYQYLTPRVWGHAISTNLVDWQILPIALNYTSEWYTQVPGAEPGVYSGSATQISVDAQGGASFPTGTNSTSTGGGSGNNTVWLSVSIPTNDMMLFATPSVPSTADPTMVNWTWDASNPVIYSTEADQADGPTATVAQPGRDPTELWPCGNNPQDGLDNSNSSSSTGTRWCMGYATQLSEGCPCNGISGMVVYSSVLQRNASAPTSWSWSLPWRYEGYMANDTEGAVMWECPDFFNLHVGGGGGGMDNNSFTGGGGGAAGGGNESVWMLKFSIGPGPSYDVPWGDPSPRDYYFTGTYTPNPDQSTGDTSGSSSTNNSAIVTSFQRNEQQYAQAMARDQLVVLDSGAFYASKSVSVPIVLPKMLPSPRSTATSAPSKRPNASSTQQSRVLFGWLPEERPVESNGDPWGWAGVQSLPRRIVPYFVPSTGTNSNSTTDNSTDGAWYIRTPPDELVMEQLRNCTAPSGTTTTPPAPCPGRRLYDNLILSVPSGNSNSTEPVTSLTTLNGTAGQQVEIIAYLMVNVSNPEGPLAPSSQCGFRVLSSGPTGGTPASNSSAVEYTEVSILGSAAGASAPGVALYVNPAMSCANPAAQVNRTAAGSAVLSSASLSTTTAAAESGSKDGMVAVQLRVIVDHSVIESYLAEGRQVITRRVYPALPNTSIYVQAYAQCSGVGCTCAFANITTYELRRAAIEPYSASDDDEDTGSDTSSNSNDTTAPWVVGVSSAAGVVLLAIAVAVGYFMCFRPVEHKGDAVESGTAETPGVQKAGGVVITTNVMHVTKAAAVDNL